jgi:hypothetical protein
MQYRVGITKCTVTLKGLARTSESIELLTKEADNYNNLYMIMILDLEGKNGRRSILTQANLSAKTFTTNETHFNLSFTYMFTLPTNGMILPINEIDPK